MSAPLRPLVFFALETEAHPFRKLLAREARGSPAILLSGIGAANAGRALSASLARHRPDLVLTCGFAGGLLPELATASVLYEADEGLPIVSRLQRWGARAARFHCAPRIAITAREKHQLHLETGADAVEMESGIIRALCRERGIPSVTVRSISDSADEDLPLDFNALMTPDWQLDPFRLARALLRHPQKVAGLLRLRRQTERAASQLAAVLHGVLISGADRVV